MLPQNAVQIYNEIRR